MSELERHATPAGTLRFRQRAVTAGVSPDHYRLLHGCWVSSIGIGSYLGNADDSTDAAYFDSVVRAVELGTSFIDTAINYRHQRSERTIGQALRHLLEQGIARRDELVIASKAGFIPFDGGRPDDPPGWVARHVVETGLASPAEIVQGSHCMTRGYLRDQLERSLRNLGVECIDLYYLHNPETQLPSVGRREFLIRLQAAFIELEKAASEGLIRAYGVATWNGFRLDPEHRQYLSVEELVRIARAAVGEGGHHLVAFQLPFNVAMHEAVSYANQTVAGDVVSTVEAANGRGIAVVASGSLGQGELTTGLPDEVSQVCPGLFSDTHRALQFARSAPGITAALVGMSQVAHVEENLVLARVAPAHDRAIAGLFADSSSGEG